MNESANRIEAVLLLFVLAVSFANAQTIRIPVVKNRTEVNLPAQQVAPPPPPAEPSVATLTGPTEPTLSFGALKVNTQSNVLEATFSNVSESQISGITASIEGPGAKDFRDCEGGKLLWSDAQRRGKLRHLRYLQAHIGEEFGRQSVGRVYRKRLAPIVGHERYGSWRPPLLLGNPDSRRMHGSS